MLLCVLPPPVPDKIIVKKIVSVSDMGAAPREDY